MAEPRFDPDRAEAFGEKILGVLNGGALSLMLSVGHRTGLFDAMRGLPPADSRRVAEAAGLNERYVREWLGAMVTGGVVEYDPPSGHYFLPPEHAAVLTREARPNNMAVTAQWVAVLAGVEDAIVERFEKGGGVPYSAFDRFHAVMAEESDQTTVAVLADAILPLMPDVLEALQRGIDVLDVGCGSGRALMEMARAHPRSRFHGYDLSDEGIAAARSAAAAAGLSNLRFEVRDAAGLDAQRDFDLVTAFDAIHDQARPDAVLAAIARALRPGGTFLMQDISGTSRLERDAEHPMGPFLYTVSCMHCMTVSLAQDGAGLGAMWGAQTATRMLEEAGFAKVEVRSLPHDPINNYFIARLEPGV